MIFGKVDVTDTAINTHRTTYEFGPITSVDVDKPFRAPAYLAAGFLALFGWSFSDLLYPQEILTIASAVTVSLITGWSVARLDILSRDLRGSSKTGAVWGTAGSLQNKRSQYYERLAAKPDSARMGDFS